MGLLDIFDGKDEEKKERPDAKKLVKPPSVFIQIGNLFVRKKDIIGVEFIANPNHLRIDVALSSGQELQSQHFSSWDAFCASRDALSNYLNLNIDIKEP